MVIRGNTFFGNMHTVVYEHFTDVEKPNIWMYWENKKGQSRPAYLDLCLETVQNNCSADFTIHVLNEKSVLKFVPIDFKQYESIWTIPQKTDYIRLYLLNKYGGIWLDFDIIVIKSLLPYYQQLLQSPHDYLGFGCYYGHCSVSMNGYGSPANWVMMSKKNGLLVRSCLERATMIVLTTPQRLQKDYHCLGKTLLYSTIDTLLHTNTDWNYIHIRSSCVERDSTGRKLTNDILLSDEEIDSKCINKLIFVPCYNTAPSFPEWFKKMNRQAILSMNSMISRLFRLALLQR
jgi:hypothetical protein